MEFGELGSRIMDVFREEIPDKYNAFKWNRSLDLFPHGSERIPVMAYTERWSFRGFEPNPNSTEQLFLEYHLTQGLLSVPPEQAAVLGKKAIENDEPTKISDDWTETLSLGYQGCGGARTGLVYVRKSDPNLLHRAYEVARKPDTLVEGVLYFSVESSSEGFESERERISQVLSQPDIVLDLLVERWKQGNR